MSAKRQCAHRARIKAGRQVEAEGQHSPWGDFFSDPRNRRLFDTDKEMMLVRIGIEIERMLVQLDHGDSPSKRPIIWSRTVGSLADRGVITPQIAKALVEFRDVRNQLIHPSGGSVTDALIASAVDSGIKLLRLLTWFSRYEPLDRLRASFSVVMSPPETGRRRADRY
jgi:hypothetical protein